MQLTLKLVYKSWTHLGSAFDYPRIRNGLKCDDVKGGAWILASEEEAMIQRVGALS